MARSPASSMRGMLAYIDEKFGSVSGYLTSIGFGPQLQDLIRYRLVEFSEPIPSNRATLSSIAPFVDNLSSDPALLFGPAPSNPPESQSLSQRIICDAPDSDLHTGLLSLTPISGSPISKSYSGVIDREGEYELRIYGPDLRASSSLFCVCEFSLKSFSTSKQSTVTPPFTLHR